MGKIKSIGKDLYVETERFETVIILFCANSEIIISIVFGLILV